MPNWLIKILGFVYEYVPKSVRPIAKTVFLWVVLRIEAIIKRRKIVRGRRIVFVENEIADLEDYEFLGPGKAEVTVRAEHTTVSPGTETAVLCGLPGARRAFPYYPGYSCAGVVIDAGLETDGFPVGQRVVGRIGHASIATVSSNQLFRVPDNVDSVSASFIELGIIVLQGVRKARISPGDRVVVLGQGLIGQMCNRMAKLSGASEVIAVATSRRREATAIKKGGADRFITLESGDVADTLCADIVIEAVGVPGAIETATRCARLGGRVALVGSARGLSRDFNVGALIRNRRLEVVGAHISAMPAHDISNQRWTYRAEGELFLKTLEMKMLSVAELVTWSARPEEANAVYECLAYGGDHHVGITFNWDPTVSENAAPG
jgi:threonine dehydrogenase-like Zn-dependent dehydrogenase